MQKADDSETVSVAVERIAELRHGQGDRVAFAPDGRRWATSDGTALHLFHDATYERREPAPGPFTDRLRFDSTGARVLLAPWIWDLENATWAALPQIEPHLADGIVDPRASGFLEARAAAWDPTGQELVIYAGYRHSRRHGATNDFTGPSQRVLVMRGATREVTATLWQGDRLDAIRAIDVSGRLIVAGGATLSVWERATQTKVADLAAHRLSALDLSFSPDGALLASAGTDGLLALWDTGRWTLLNSWQIASGELHAVAFHPTRSLLVTGGADSQVSFWSFGGKLVHAESLDGAVIALACSPSGDRLVAAVSGSDPRMVLMQMK
jgi:WD40 repeat protein